MSDGCALGQSSQPAVCLLSLFTTASSASTQYYYRTCTLLYFSAIHQLRCSLFRTFLSRIATSLLFLLHSLALAPVRILLNILCAAVPRRESAHSCTDPLNSHTRPIVPNLLQPSARPLWLLKRYFLSNKLLLLLLLLCFHTDAMLGTTVAHKQKLIWPDSSENVSSTVRNWLHRA